MLLKMNVEMIAKKKPHSFTAKKKSGRYKCVAAYPSHLLYL